MTPTGAGGAPFLTPPRPPPGLNSCWSRSSSSVKRPPSAGKLEKVAAHDRQHQQPDRTAGVGPEAGEPPALRPSADAAGHPQDAVVVGGGETRQPQNNAPAGPGRAPRGGACGAQPNSPATAGEPA